MFTQFFHDDIMYLLSMENLWKKRKAPVPLDINDLQGYGKDVVEILAVIYLLRCLKFNTASAEQDSQRKIAMLLDS
jgi:hypothetical protein